MPMQDYLFYTRSEQIILKLLYCAYNTIATRPATNGSSGLMDKPPITKEESKISPASYSSIPSTILLSEITPTNV
jgi:hypothetical protein